MKRFKFVMEDGSAVDIIAADFRSACLRFDAFGVDPQDILEIQEKELTAR
jgi:hypothetical protein